MSNEAVTDNPVEEPTPQVVHDPVCHMDITATDAQGTAEYLGLTYYFCSTSCHQRFDANPEGVVEAEGSYNHEKGPDTSVMSEEPNGSSTAQSAFGSPSTGSTPSSSGFAASQSETRADAGFPSEAEFDTGYSRSWGGQSGQQDGAIARAAAMYRRKPVLGSLVALGSGSLVGLLLTRMIGRRR